ncbi:neutral zinc metallopeptidase [Nocardiopsis coralliicola]
MPPAAPYGPPQPPPHGPARYGPPPYGAAPFGLAPYRPPGPSAPPQRKAASRALVWTAAGTAAAVSLTAALAAGALVAAQVGAATDPARQAVDPSTGYNPELTVPPEAVAVDVADHPAYGLDAPAPVDCPLPDLQPSSDTSWKSFSAELGDCLNDLWRPRLEEVGVRGADPSFHTTDTDPDGLSSDEGMTLAYYSGSDHSITVVLPNVTELSGEFPARDQEGVWAALIAHEYGHHVQQVTGVLGESYAMEAEAATEGEELEALRRTELQAECMAGLALPRLGTFSGASVDRVNDLLNGGDDLATHGSADNRQEWYDRGAAADTLDDCNTYAASPPSVR